MRHLYKGKVVCVYVCVSYRNRNLGVFQVDYRYITVLKLLCKSEIHDSSLLFGFSLDVGVSMWGFVFIQIQEH